MSTKHLPWKAAAAFESGSELPTTTTSSSKMAASKLALLLCLVALGAVQGADILVGGAEQWRTGFDYEAWVRNTTITADDTLVFLYSRTHNVVELFCPADFEACVFSSTSCAIRAPFFHGDSEDINNPIRVPLNSTATRYFACSVGNHCRNGLQKFSVTPLASAGATPATTVPASNISSAPAPAVAPGNTTAVAPATTSAPVTAPGSGTGTGGGQGTRGGNRTGPTSAPSPTSTIIITAPLVINNPGSAVTTPGASANSTTPASGTSALSVSNAVAVSVLVAALSVLS